MAKLSIIKKEMIDQYYRFKRNIDLYEKEIKSHCVKGYISHKKIKGRDYYYLQWSQDKKIRSKYIKPEHLRAIEDNISLRKKYEQSIKQLKLSVEEIESFVGMDNLKKYKNEFNLQNNQTLDEVFEENTEVALDYKKEQDL